MTTASPITRQTVGRTFIVAISMLGSVALGQLATVVWVFIARSQAPSLNVPGTLAQRPVSPTPGGVATVNPPAVAPPDEANFSADPLAEPGLPGAISTPATAGLTATPPKPTPLPIKTPGLLEPEQGALFKETIAKGKLLRDGGDMSTALTRFREAAAMDAKNPEALFEMAVTYEKMQLNDQAGEQWRRIFDLGEGAGPYFTAAEAKINQAKAIALKELSPQLVQETEEGIAAGKTLGLLKVETQDHEDKSSAKHLSIRIPIKARAREKIDVRDLTIQVLFYDIVDNTNLVQTTANVSSRWTTAPADWLDASVETLEVDYQLPLPEARGARKESRKYFGYLVRVYYKGDLQAASGEPDRLVQQFSPEQKLPTDTNKP
ncbi:MAG: hypothetical protein QOE70_6414 [Chthoniobacter sp.]|jgi:tetratricopeptide (TPR) repeat protein|nr:hypothetical protein [Chthoniobacter sp.]